MISVKNTVNQPDRLLSVRLYHWVLKGAVGPRVELFLETGLCGGSTTFSTFALEAAGLLWRGSWGEACIYIAVSLIVGLAAVTLGQRIVG